MEATAGRQELSTALKADTIGIAEAGKVQQRHIIYVAQD
jgi:hypothetical protein